jgi:hypothetical protein
MKGTAIAAYICAPAVLTVGTFAMALTRESLGVEMFLAYAVGGFLYYAGPYFIWVVIAALGKFSDVVWHAGFVASSIALVAISVFWLFPGDRSGLPLQWVLYWPLAIILQTVLAGLSALFSRSKPSNIFPSTDTQQQQQQQDAAPRQL